MEEIKTKENSIKYTTLIMIILSFTLGTVTTLVVLKATISNPETFSITGLIGFLFGIALSGASIVLAITAIALGKSSERVMTERSDESIRIQNEVFMKTTDALQRIEASTGVTEKRIEDIISGRAGALSYEIAEIASKGTGLKDRKALEMKIKDSILREIRHSPSLQDTENKRQEIIERAERYDQFLNKITLAFTNSKNIIAEKIGSGSFSGVGFDLFDGVYALNGKSFAVAAIGSNQKEKFVAKSDYIIKISEEISKGKIEKVYIIVDDDIETAAKFKELVQELLNELKHGEKISFVGIPLEEVDNGIKKLIESIT